MIRTQVQLPDELYARVKRFSREREMTLAEVVRRSLELLLDRYPGSSAEEGWELPAVDCGPTLVALEDLHAVVADEESIRGYAAREAPI